MSELDAAAKRVDFSWQQRKQVRPITLPLNEGYPQGQQQAAPLPITDPSGIIIPGLTPIGLPLLGWQVIARQISSTWNWGVIKGILFDTQENDPTQSSPIDVTGCLTPGTIIKNTDAGWTPIGSTPAKIWMEVEYTTGGWPTIDSAYIANTDYDGGALEYGTTTDGMGNTIYVQTFARRILGYVLAFNTDGSPQLMTGGFGSLYLTNGGDFACNGSGGSPQPTPIIFPRA
jgi:hypothetical protein